MKSKEPIDISTDPEAIHVVLL